MIMKITRVKVYEDCIDDTFRDYSYGEPHKYLTNVEFDFKTGNGTEKTLSILFDNDKFKDNSNKFTSDDYLIDYAKVWLQRSEDGQKGYFEILHHKGQEIKYDREGIAVSDGFCYPKF